MRRLLSAPAASLALLLTVLTVPVPAATPAAPLAVTHDQAAKKVTVTVDGELFTELHYNTFAKPILWPLNGPGGVRMTRDWPMKKDTPGEDQDHPHHKSLWFNHGNVNGVDFWKEADDAGTIVTTAVPRAEVDAPDRVVIEVRNEWKAPEGRTICSDTTVIRLGRVYATFLEQPAHFVEYQITVAATAGEVVFGDTKEGTMAIRTRPELNVERKNPLAAGTSRNSEGLTGAALWGQRAAWVDYQAPIDGRTFGIAIFDHPSNLRHPTTWHARDYGLVAANPFGLHDFSKKNPKRAGNHVIPAGGTQSWKYGFLLYAGALTAEQVDTLWQNWRGAIHGK